MLQTCWRLVETQIIHVNDRHDTDMLEKCFRHVTDTFIDNLKTCYRLVTDIYVWKISLICSTSFKNYWTSAIQKAKQMKFGQMSIYTIGKLGIASTTTIESKCLRNTQNNNERELSAVRDARHIQSTINSLPTQADLTHLTLCLPSPAACEIYLIR